MSVSRTVSVQTVAETLPELLSVVASGGEVVIARDDVPVAKLVPVAAEVQQPRMPGRYAGQFDVGPEFFEPLPEEELAAWGLA